MNSVAFFAYLGSDQEVQPAETVVFDNVDVNMANGYSTSSGEFTCPVSGLYFFSFQIHTTDDRSWTAQIRIRNDDGTNRGAGATRFHNSFTHSATATSVVECQVNEKVYVRNEYDSYGVARSIFEYGDQEGVWQSYFNGFLIDLL